MKNSGRQQAQPVQAGLDGIDKVTALLLAMGKPSADRIIKQFEDAEIRLLARSAAQLPALSIEEVEVFLAELNREFGETSMISGSSDGAQALISGVVADEQIAEIMGELAGQPPKLIWSRLNDVGDERIAGFLAAEQPQVATFVLSKLSPEKASTVMGCLDANLQAELSMRLLSLGNISDDAVRLIADRLERDLLSGVAELEPERNQYAMLGAILNKLDRDKSMAILEHITAVRPQDAIQVRNYVFTFEDIVRLSAEDRSRLFDEVPAERVAAALHNCEAPLKEQILTALSPRARRLVESELASGTKVTEKVVREARRAVAGLAISLAERSVISLGASAKMPE